MKTFGIILPQTLFSQIQDQSEWIKRKGQADLQMVRFPSKMHPLMKQQLNLKYEIISFLDFGSQLIHLWENKVM